MILLKNSWVGVKQQSLTPYPLNIVGYNQKNFNDTSHHWYFLIYLDIVNNFKFSAQKDKLQTRYVSVRSLSSQLVYLVMRTVTDVAFHIQKKIRF